MVLWYLISKKCYFCCRDININGTSDIVDTYMHCGISHYYQHVYIALYLYVLSSTCIMNVVKKPYNKMYYNFVWTPCNAFYYSWHMWSARYESCFKMALCFIKCQFWWGNSSVKYVWRHILWCSCRSELNNRQSANLEIPAMFHFFLALLGDISNPTSSPTLPYPHTPYQPYQHFLYHQQFFLSVRTHIATTNGIG